VRRLGGLGRAAIEAALGEAVLAAGAAGRGGGPACPARWRATTPPTRPRGRWRSARASAPAGRGGAGAAPRARGRAGPWAVLPDDPTAAGRALYRVLRELDAAGARELWLEAVPDTPGWAAIADRLARAVVPARAGRRPEEGT
jgi:L-threonylcarbamoyladenylate synthase